MKVMRCPCSSARGPRRDLLSPPGTDGARGCMRTHGYTHAPREERRAVGARFALLAIGGWLPGSAGRGTASRAPAASSWSGLLSPLVGSHPGKREEIDHLELSGDPAASLRECRLPPPVGVQVGVLVELQQPDEDLADDAAADRPQMSAPVSQDEPLPEAV